MLARSLLDLVQPGLTYGTPRNQNDRSTCLIGNHLISRPAGSQDLSVQHGQPSPCFGEPVRSRSTWLVCAHGKDDRSKVEKEKEKEKQIDIASPGFDPGPWSELDEG